MLSVNPLTCSAKYMFHRVMETDISPIRQEFVTCSFKIRRASRILPNIYNSLS